MQYNIRFLVIMLCLSGSLLAHTGSITGTVTDSLSGESIPYTNVSLINTGFGTVVNEQGEFFLENIPEGSYQIQFSYIGYNTVIRKINIQSNHIVNLDIKLHRIILDLSEISVISQLDPDETFNSINKIDIQLRPINSSQEVLRIVPGLFIAQHGGGGKAEQIFLRGFDNDHGTDIDISVDGVPVNMVSHAHGQGYADLHFLIPETIEKVDFNKGPYYADHGDFNTTGYVNFQTRNSLSENIIKLEGGSFDTWRTMALINVLRDVQNDHNLYIGGEFFYTRSYFDLPQNFNRLNLIAKYSGRIDANNTMSVSASTFTSNWDQSGQIADRAVNQYGWINRFGALDLTEGGNTGRTNINFKAITTLSKKSFLENQIYFLNYDFNLWSNFTFWLNDTLTGDQIRQAEARKIYGYRSRYSHVSDLYGNEVKSDLGVGIRYDDIPRILLFNNSERNIVVDSLAFGQVRQSNLSLYYSGTVNFTSQVSMNIGIRYDHFYWQYIDDRAAVYTSFSTNKGIINPKLNFYYNYSSDFRIYLRTGSGFHSNDARTIAQGGTEKFLPRAWSADLGTFFKPFNPLILHLAAWGLYLEEELVYVGDEAIVEPSDETMRIGFDFSLRYQILSDLFLDLDYSYARGRFINFPDGENYIPLAPIHTSMGGLTYKRRSGLNMSLRYRYVSDRPANEVNSVTALGSLIWDISVAYRFNRLELYVKMENITNEQWNEAQFDTESRLRGPDTKGGFTGRLEANSISELHYTPGSPFFIRGGLIFYL
jgi:hypothetical protein